MLAAVALGGCFPPQFLDGKTPCSGNADCPNGLYCATDHRCWHTGHNPVVDMSEPGDMALPPPLKYPAAAVWISSGGGILDQPGGATLELTISAEFAVGTAATVATPSPSITFGYFSSLTK